MQWDHRREIQFHNETAKRLLQKFLQRTSPANTNFSIELYHPSNYGARLINRKNATVLHRNWDRKLQLSHILTLIHSEGPCCLGVRYNSSQLAPSTSTGFRYITGSFAVTFQKLFSDMPFFISDVTNSHSYRMIWNEGALVPEAAKKQGNFLKYF